MRDENQAAAAFHFIGYSRRSFSSLDPGVIAHWEAEDAALDRGYRARRLPPLAAVRPAAAG